MIRAADDAHSKRWFDGHSARPHSGCGAPAGKGSHADGLDGVLVILLLVWRNMLGGLFRLGSNSRWRNLLNL